MSTAHNPPAQTVGTVAQWAKTQGITRDTAFKRVRAHNIPYVANGKIDFSVADAICDASMNPKKMDAVAASRNGGAAAVERPVSELGKLQMERERIRIKIDQAQLDELEGKLVPLDTVRAYESAMFAQVRSSMLVIGSELRDDLAGLTDPAQIEKMINGRVNQALMKLAAWKPAK